MSLRPQGTGRILSIMPTWRCNAACRNCGTLSSPHANAKLTPEKMLSAIEQAADLGYGVVAFTGGEPTLEMSTLLKGIQRSSERGMITRVVTNAHWAITDPDSLEVLHRLHGAGLNEINFSTGDQHVRFVPIENVLRAIRASAELNYIPAVNVELTAVRTVSKQTLLSHPYMIETFRLYPDLKCKIDESPWMPLRPSKRENYPPGVAIEQRNLGTTRGCDSILNTTTLQADGSLGSCCGLGMRLIPELQLGNIEDITIEKALESANEDFLKRWMRLEGPWRILQWAAERDPEIEWEGQYAHRCQACLKIYKDDRIRKVLQERFLEKVPDVLYGEYLLYSYTETSE